MRKLDTKQLLNILVLYAGIFLVWQLFMAPRQGGQPTPPATLMQQAQKLEGEARDQKLPRADRLGKYDEAIRKYQDVYHHEGTKPVAIDARYQELRVLNEQAGLNKDDTAYYDKSESLLKDMQSHLAGQSATVSVPPPAPIEPVGAGVRSPRPGKAAVGTPDAGTTTLLIPDVGKDATQRLDGVRLAREQIHRHDPRFVVMDFLVRLTGYQPWFSFWFALVLLNLVLKALLWPAQKKTFKYMRDMQKVAPLIKQMQEQMKSRPAEEQQKKMMLLYKEHGVSPAGGCMPMLLQAIVLIPVFTMIRMYEYQFTKGYFLWIGSSLSQRWPAWFGLNLASFDVPMFVIYIGTTILSSLLQPPAADPQQRQQQKMMTWMMPIIFGGIMWYQKWSSAFMFYWAVQSIITIWQNWLLLQRFGPPPATVPAGEGPAPVPTEPLKPMGANGNGNGRRPSQTRIQPKKRKKGSKA